MNIQLKFWSSCFFLSFLVSISMAQTVQYTMPEESEEHEGTWLQWPHNHLYGPWYRGDVTPTFVAMTNALQAGEKVHIIAYDNNERNFIQNRLNNAGVPMTNIDFYIYPTDDVWSRDNGPIFVHDQNGDLVILDWGFNGWGFDTPYSLDDVIPQSVSSALTIPRIDLSAMVLEGGAIEHDGQGTMMATRSSITDSSRNPGLTESQIEAYLTNYMGFTKFIWLDGVVGQDITDHHIDGFVKFANDSTIVTMDSADLYYWYVSNAEMDLIYNASNVNNKPYDIVIVPLTQNDVTTAYGSNLGYKGSYVNYYIGNDVVLVPTYNDPNDAVAINIIQTIYPNRTVMGVDVRNLYEYGGMIHCVTQQQPVAIQLGCPEVNNLIVSNINASAAQLQWDVVTAAHHYTIMGGKTGTAGFTTLNIAGGGTNFKQVFGLGSGNSYWWQIQAHCDANETLSSNWSHVDTFTVLTPSCNTPTTHWTTNVTNNSATFNWTPMAGAIGYIVRGAPAGTPLGQWTQLTITPGNTSSKTVNGLNSGQNFEWQIASGCNANPLQLSTWSATASFTTGNSANKLSSNKNEQMEMVCFPNPARDEVRIVVRELEAVRQLSIYNATGKLVYHQVGRKDFNDNHNTNFVVNTSAYSPGLYFVKVESDNQVVAAVVSIIN